MRSECFRSLSVRFAVIVSCLGGIGAAVSAQCVPPPPGLISWWDGDAISASTCFDRGDINGNFNDGRLYNAVFVEAGLVGQGFRFSSGQVNAGRAASLKPSALTLEAWVFLPSLPTGPRVIVGKEFVSGRSSYALVYRVSPARMTFTICNSAQTEFQAAATGVAANAWQHWAGTYDGTDLKIYLNGVLQQTTSAGIAIAHSDAFDFKIGRASSSATINNLKVDEVALYGRALGASEVQAIYTTGSAGKCKLPPQLGVPPPMSGFTFGGFEVNDSFGQSVANLGDTNGDGFTDFAIGAPGVIFVTKIIGRVGVFSGCDGLLLRTFEAINQGPGIDTPSEQNAAFGWSVAGPGDVDTDGHADVLVGSPHFRTVVEGSARPGRAVLFSGATGLAIWERTGSGSDRFGLSVAAAGDVNGDAVPDWIVGANTDSFSSCCGGSGYAKVFLGPVGNEHFTVSGGADGFGKAVGGGVDVNADGFADVIVGAPLGGSPTPPGYVNVYSGQSGSLLHTLRGSTERTSRFGWSVGGVADVNGDGRDEVIVGAVNDLGAFGHGEYGRGSIWVFSGMTGLPLFVHQGDVAGDHLGVAVAGSGDVDGDGVPDYAGGAHQGGIPNSGPIGPGFVRVYSGASGSPIFRFSGLPGTTWFGQTIAATGDVTHDGKRDLLVGARGYAQVVSSVRTLVAGCVPPDTEPPVVTIESPAEGSVFGDTTLTVVATVEDASASHVVFEPGGFETDLPAGGDTVTGTVGLLVEGTNTITVTATDSFGNVGADSVAVILDTICPVIFPLSPPPGAILGESPTTLTIRVEDATATTVTFGSNAILLPPGGDTVSGEVALQEGPNTLPIEAIDAAGNSCPVMLHLTLDSTAPIVTIDSPANGACFGPGDSPISVVATVDDATATTVTSVPEGVSGPLAPGGGPVPGSVALVEGFNTITVSATDEAGNVGMASIVVLLDTTPPVVDLVSPQADAPVRGTIDLHGTAEDPAPGTGVAQVVLLVDASVAASFTAPPYEATFDTTALTDGTHTFTVVATDGKDNSATDSVDVLVDNTPPEASVVSPTSGAFVSGTVSFTAIASDGGSRLVSIEMLAGGGPPTVDGSANYSPPVASDSRTSQVDTTAFLDGPLTLSVRAVDAAGNEATDSVTVTVDNTAPEKSLLAPTDGSVVSGIIEIVASASDANFASLEILVDGVSLGLSTTSPFTVSDDTRERLDGQMVVTVIARDLAGNFTTCSAVVTVDNISFRLTPRTLNLGSKGGDQSVTAHLAGPNVSLLVPPEEHEVFLSVPGGDRVPATPGFAVLADSNGDEIPDQLTLKFDRQALIASLNKAGIPSNSNVTVALVAERAFVIGTDVIRIIGQ